MHRNKIYMEFLYGIKSKQGIKGFISLLQGNIFKYSKSLKTDKDWEPIFYCRLGKQTNF